MRGRRSGTTALAATPFPGYANVAELASGAFATVYKAVELGTGRPVALKVLRLADTSPHLVEVFEKELGALALLSNHPNVTTLYGTFSTAEGRPVLVLELCRGSLAHRVRQSGPLAAGDVVQVGIKIAGALETAHRSGLLHRDMKPQNILVSQFDEPVLADFGVATLQAQAQSTEGVFGFTTLHAPPEALEGLPLSPSADIYGLASSMYQLLAGRGPFSSYEGEAPASVILRILRDPAPRAPSNDVPVALADLMENALAKDPGKRPQTAGAFAEALREIEALAGWSQTPYVVWGASQAAPGAEDGPVRPAPNRAAARLSQLLHAETEAIGRLPGSGAQVTPAPPKPVADLSEAAGLVPAAVPDRQLLAPQMLSPQVPSPQVAQGPEVPSAPASRAPAKAPRPSSSRLPKRPAQKAAPRKPAPQTPTPPGTRAVIAPQPQPRNVLTPLAGSAQVRLVAPAQRSAQVTSWLTPLPATTQGAAWDRQWPLSPVPAQPSWPDRLRPGGARRLIGSSPGLHAARGASRRKRALLFVCVSAGTVVVVAGLGWAAIGHLF